MGTISLPQSHRCSAWASTLLLRLSRDQARSINFHAHDLQKHLLVAAVDAKEHMEYAPELIRALVIPAHFVVLCFTLQPVSERKVGVKCFVGRAHEARWAQEACHNRTDVLEH